MTKQDNSFGAMKQQLKTKELFNQAKTYAYEYIDHLESMPVFPAPEALDGLAAFDEPLPKEPANPEAILALLHQNGSPATVAQTGGRYFGFVNGSTVPAAMASRWLSDVWDQNCGIYVMSPVASKLEELCERWLVSLLRLPKGTAMGLVSGSSMAIFCALCAARNELLKRQGWDANSNGLFGAPPLRVVLGEQAHSSVFKALSLLGLGRDRVERVPVDSQGRILPEQLPPLDAYTLVIAQAGHVNTGAFDPIDKICAAARKAGAWVHVDGAFGLWAAASPNTYPLIKGLEDADSWSADAHKTLNAPYDCGIVLCKDRSALVCAMQAAGSYIQFSEHRDGMLYCTDMSRRARSVELWATLKSLGSDGVAQLVERLCENARYFAQCLAQNGFEILNDVVYNQVLVQCKTPEQTTATLNNIQAGTVFWCGGATWEGKPVIRLSVCSWKTTRQDIDACVKAFVQARDGH